MGSPNQEVTTEESSNTLQGSTGSNRANTMDFVESRDLVLTATLIRGTSAQDTLDQVTALYVSGRSLGSVTYLVLNNELAAVVEIYK